MAEIESLQIKSFFFYSDYIDPLQWINVSQWTKFLTRLKEKMAEIKYGKFKLIFFPVVKKVEKLRQSKQTYKVSSSINFQFEIAKEF